MHTLFIFRLRKIAQNLIFSVDHHIFRQTLNKMNIDIGLRIDVISTQIATFRNWFAISLYTSSGMDEHLNNILTDYKLWHILTTTKQTYRNEVISIVCTFCRILYMVMLCLCHNRFSHKNCKVLFSIHDADISEKQVTYVSTKYIHMHSLFCIIFFLPLNKLLIQFTEYFTWKSHHFKGTTCFQRIVYFFYFIFLLLLYRRHWYKLIPYKSMINKKIA